MRWVAKVDKNQAEIVDAVRQAGATVTCTHMVGHGFPDLVAGVRGVTLTGSVDWAPLLSFVIEELPGALMLPGANLLLEVKNPEYASKLTKAERNWHNNWRGQAAVIESAEDAFRLFKKF